MGGSTMIIREEFKSDYGIVPLYRTFSDNGFRIRQIETGIVYDEAVDIAESTYTYEETDIPIDDATI